MFYPGCLRDNIIRVLGRKLFWTAAELPSTDNWCSHFGWNRSEPIGGDRRRLQYQSIAITGRGLWGTRDNRSSGLLPV